MTSISHYNKPTVVLFALLTLAAAFHEFSSSMIITFDPTARFRSNIFQTVCNHKAHPPKMFLILQIIAAIHHKPGNSNFWESGVRKMDCIETFLQTFKNCFEILHTSQKTHLML